MSVMLRTNLVTRNLWSPDVQGVRVVKSALEFECIGVVFGVVSCGTSSFLCIYTKLTLLRHLSPDVVLSPSPVGPSGFCSAKHGLSYFAGK